MRAPADVSEPKLPTATNVPAKKKLIRRPDRDRSQQIRHAVQYAFLALNVVIGVQFYCWVRHFESGGGTPYVSRPAGVEGWLPIAGLMSLKAFLVTGVIPRVHPAGLFLFIAFLLISLAFRKAFCSWLCPIGTFSEWLWKLGHKLLGRNLRLPRWADIALRSFKYLLLAFFVNAVVGMSAAQLVAFMRSPYGLIVDVKMLNFFRHLGHTSTAVLGILVLLSLIVENFWCRYLCPYGALMGLASLMSPARIRREPEPCIDCAKCAKACPSSLPVDALITIKSAECTGCMQCVAVCPAEGALYLSLPQRRRVSPIAVAVGIAAMFLGIVGLAKATHHWNSDVPAQVYYELVPNAADTSHPFHEVR